MRLLAILITLFFAPAAWAQLSLQAYRDSVLMRSNEILAAQAQTSLSQAEMQRAKTDFLPSLTADGSITTDLRHSAGSERWSFGLTPTLRQTIYSGGAIRAAYRQAELRLLASREGQRQAWLDVRYAADMAYWGLSAMQLYMAATNEYVSIIASLHSVVQERYREGYVAKSDMLQVEARLSEARFSLIEARNDYDVALHRFNNLLDRQQPSEEELANSIIDSIAMPSRITIDELLDRRADVREVAISVDIAKQGVVAARAQYNPTLFAGVSGSWQTYSPNSSGKTYLDGAVVVGFSVPIFHWSERRYSTSAARSRVRIAEADLGQIRRDVALEEADGWSALTSSYSQMQSSLRNLSIAGENLSISTYSYSEGQATVLEVLQAQISWIQIYTNAITARFNYAVAVSNYLRLTAR